MSRSPIWVSGLLNTETTAAVRRFPIEYYPIDYPFFGVRTAVSGVGLNLTAALRALGDEVRLASMVGQDFGGEQVLHRLGELGVDTALVSPVLGETPASVVLHAPDGRRQIYCDLKDIQETPLPLTGEALRAALSGCALAAVCNINFNRPVLAAARELGIPIATDVHVLSDPEDTYNREFMECADLLFLSDEGLSGDYAAFLRQLGARYPQLRVIVLGCGGSGAMLYTRSDGRVRHRPAVPNPHIANTVGAGDALFSGFLHRYAQGADPVDCLDFAQAFASYKLSTSGGAEGFGSEKAVERWRRARS